MHRTPPVRSDGIELVTLCADDSGCASSIAEIWERAWKAEPSPNDLEAAACKVAEEIRRINPAEKALIVARKGGETVAFCRIAAHARDNSLWWVRGVAVRADWQRSGVGTDLLRAGVRYAARYGAALVGSATDPWNYASIRCHEKAGFMNEGEFVAEDGERKVGFSTRTFRAGEERS